MFGKIKAMVRPDSEWGVKSFFAERFFASLRINSSPSVKMSFSLGLNLVFVWGKIRGQIYEKKADENF